jgi:hypothetical protein
MVLAAADLTNWWVGYIVGASLVVVVALLVLTITITAKRIARVAEDATHTLVIARDRTEALWRVNTTNQVASEILSGAKAARRALGGGNDEAQGATERDRERARAQHAELHNVPEGPHIDPELGT